MLFGDNYVFNVHGAAPTHGVELPRSCPHSFVDAVNLDATAPSKALQRGIPNGIEVVDRFFDRGRF